MSSAVAHWCRCDQMDMDGTTDGVDCEEGAEQRVNLSGLLLSLVLVWSVNWVGIGIDER